MTSGFAPEYSVNSPAVPNQTEQSVLKDTLLDYFAQLPDPRIDRTKYHLLIDIIAIAILAVIAGADGWEAIETFGKSKQATLEQFLSLPNGIPGHDTFRRVFARLDPQQFQQCFLNWINAITQSLGAEVIALDGKTLKGSYDRNEHLKALHVVSTWTSEHGLNKSANEGGRQIQ